MCKSLHYECAQNNGICRTKTWLRSACHVPELTTRKITLVFGLLHKPWRVLKRASIALYMHRQKVNAHVRYDTRRRLNVWTLQCKRSFILFTVQNYSCSVWINIKGITHIVGLDKLCFFSCLLFYSCIKFLPIILFKRPIILNFWWWNQPKIPWFRIHDT